MAPKSPTSPSKRRNSSAANTFRRRSSSKLPPASPPPHQPRSPSTKPVKQAPSSPPNPQTTTTNTPTPSSPSSSPTPFEPVEKARHPTPPWHARKSWQFGPEAFAGPVTPGRFKGGRRKRSSGISPKGRAASQKSSPSPRKSVSFEEGRRERAFEVGSPPALVSAGLREGSTRGWRPLGPSTRDAGEGEREGEAVASAMRVAKVETLTSSPPLLSNTRTSSASPTLPSSALRKFEPRSSSRSESKSHSPGSPSSPPRAIVRPRSFTPSQAQFSPLQLDRRSTSSSPVAPTSPPYRSSSSNASSSPVAPTSPPYGSSSSSSSSSKAGSKSPAASPAWTKNASVYSPTSPPVPNARLPAYSPTRPGVGPGIRSPGINASLRSPGPYVADDEREEGELDEPTPRTLRRKRMENHSSSPSVSKSRSRSRSRASTSLPRPSYPCPGFQRRASPFTPSPAPLSSSSSSSHSRRSGSGSQPASPLGRLFRVIGEISSRSSQSQDSSDAGGSQDDEVWDSLFVAASQGYRALVRHVERLLETHGIHHVLSLLARQGHGGEDGVFRTQWRFALRYVGEPEVDVEEALVLTRMLLDEVEGLEEQTPRLSIDVAIRRWEELVARFIGDEDDRVLDLDLDQERRLQFEDAVGDFARAYGFYAFAQVFNSSHPGEASFLLGNLVRGNGENEPQTFYYPAEPLWIRAVVGAIIADEDVESLRPNAAGETADYPEWYEVVQYEIDWLRVLEGSEEGAEETMVRDTGTEVEALALIEERVEEGTAWGSIFRMLREHIRGYGLETLVRQTFADLSAPVAEALRRDPRAAALELGRLTPTRYYPEDNVAALMADEMVWMRRHRTEAPYPPELVGSWEPPRGVDANNWARSVIQGLREENDDLVTQLRERNRQLVEAQREVERSYDREYHLQQRIADLEGTVQRLRARWQGSQDAEEAELRCGICGRTFAADEEGQEDLEHHTELHRRTIQQYELLESEGWLDALDDLDLTPRLGARRPSSLAFSSRRSSSRSAGSKRKSSSSHYTDDGRGSRSASFASSVRSPTKRRRRATEVLIPRRSVGSSVESLRSSEKSSSAGSPSRRAFSSVRSATPGGGASVKSSSRSSGAEDAADRPKPGLRRSSRIAKLKLKNERK